MLFVFNNIYEVIYMAKDSQVDKKKDRMEKANWQTPITKENQNQNRNAKKQSVKPDDI